MPPVPPLILVGELTRYRCRYRRKLSARRSTTTASFPTLCLSDVPRRTRFLAINVFTISLIRTRYKAQIAADSLNQSTVAVDHSGVIAVETTPRSLGNGRYEFLELRLGLGSQGSIARPHGVKIGEKKISPGAHGANCDQQKRYMRASGGPPQ